MDAENDQAMGDAAGESTGDGMLVSNIVKRVVMGRFEVQKYPRQGAPHQGNLPNACDPRASELQRHLHVDHSDQGNGMSVFEYDGLVIHGPDGGFHRLEAFDVAK